MIMAWKPQELQGGSVMNLNGITSSAAAALYGARSPKNVKSSDTAECAGSTEQAEGTVKESGIEEILYTKGKTVGQPTLSKKATEYYEKLKKKFSNMDFILVSGDKKQQTQANAAAYGNANKPVVLIDEDKIEEMAKDEKVAKKFEDIIANASKKLPELEESLKASGADIKGLGIRVHDDGTASFFAVMNDSMTKTRETLAEKRAEKKEEAKAAEKKADKKKAEEKIKEKRAEQKEKDKGGEEDLKVSPKDTNHANETGEVTPWDMTGTITFSSNSIEDLVKQVSAYVQESATGSIRTPQEKMIGSHIDFSG